MSQILTMAVQNLNESDRDDMVRYMKQAMVGTFFERWLKMGGWIGKTVESDGGEGEDDGGGKMPKRQKTANDVAATAASGGVIAENEAEGKPSAIAATAATAMPVQQNTVEEPSCSCCCTSAKNAIDTADTPTSAAELEKLIRAIGTNPNLNAEQKNLTIQGLRDSVWKNNCRVSKRKREEGDNGAVVGSVENQIAQSSTAVASAAATGSRADMTVRQPHQTHHLRYVLYQIHIPCILFKGQWNSTLNHSSICIASRYLKEWGLDSKEKHLHLLTGQSQQTEK